MPDPASLDMQPPERLIAVAQVRGISEEKASAALIEAVQRGAVAAWWDRPAGFVPVPAEDLNRLYIDIEDGTALLHYSEAELGGVDPRFFRQRILLSERAWGVWLGAHPARRGGGRPRTHDWLKAFVILIVQLCHRREATDAEAATILREAFAEYPDPPDNKDIRLYAAEANRRLRNIRSQAEN